MTVADAFSRAHNISATKLDEFLERHGCELQHSAMFRGYVSRKIGGRAIIDWEKQRVIVFRPNFASTRYCSVSYYYLPADIERSVTVC